MSPTFKKCRSISSRPSPTPISSPRCSRRARHSSARIRARRRVRFHDLQHELLTGLARPGVVRLAVGDVVRYDADAEEWNLKRAGDSRRRSRFHFLGGGSELIVKSLNAIELAVPDVARPDHAVHDTTLAIGAACAVRCRE